MTEFTRHDFLRYTLSGLGAILAARFISACSPPQTAPGPPQPIAKQHGSSRLTLGMKNLMGTINSAQMFHINLHQRIADLASRIQPTLTIIDAIRILTANGPTGGNLSDVKKLDTVIAGTDIVAVDSYATSLFGLKPDDIPHIKIAAGMGLGSSDLNKLEIKEVELGSS